MAEPDSMTQKPVLPLNEGVAVPATLVAAMDGATIPLSLLENGAGGAGGEDSGGLTFGELQAMVQ